MQTDTDAVTEIELCAYVDGQLDMARRFVVEDYLSRHPQAAAAVMSDLRDRDATRLALGAPAHVRDDAVALARQLDRKLRGATRGWLLPRAFTAVLAVLCLWLAQDELGEVFAPAKAATLPEFADEALDTHSAARLRQGIPTETKDRTVDVAAIWKSTQIIFPQPAREWRILDSRLVPTDEGPGVQISFDRGEGTQVTFFAVRTRGGASPLPKIAKRGGQAVAYWRRGQFGYALAGELAPEELAQLANDMADNPTG